MENRFVVLEGVEDGEREIEAGEKVYICFVFETGFPCVSLAVVGLYSVDQAGLDLVEILLIAGITGVRHQRQLSTVTIKR